ncbi:hypothetical protein BGZ70_004857, partial [Mortierella alpina]
MASPIDTSNSQQNAFTPPAATPVTVCGTVVGIDFAEEAFSVGIVNAEDQVELIRNKNGDIYTQIPVTDDYYLFEPDPVYDLDEFDSINIQAFYSEVPPLQFIDPVGDT